MLGTFSIDLYMPTTLLEHYFPVLIQVIIALAVGAGLIGASALLGKRVKNAVKNSAYECGMVPYGTAKERFSVKFYLVAMLFILFDIEAIFLYPWAVVFRDLKMFGFFEMLVFVLLILAGFFYIYKKGALDWTAEELKPIQNKPHQDVLRPNADVEAKMAEAKLEETKIVEEKLINAA